MFGRIVIAVRLCVSFIHERYMAGIIGYQADRS